MWVAVFQQGVRIALALSLPLWLTGCVATTEPLITSQEPVVQHTVKVQVYRAADDAISHYDHAQIQQTLGEVEQTLRTRGMAVSFEIQPSIEIDESFEDLYSQDILHLSGRFRVDPDKKLRIIITNKIWSCGNNSYETTVILGCTPVGSPVVVVQGMVDGSSSNYGTTDVILWLHEMGHSVQLGHADSWKRVMTPAPQPDSTQLERYEVRQYGSLGEQLRAQVVHAAVAAPKPMSADMRPAEVDVVAHVRQAGLHGLDLTPLKSMTDAQLLPLTSLLNTSEPLSAQANALAALGQLGGDLSLNVVVAYLTQGPPQTQREVKEAGLIALAKNENPEVLARATRFVIQATSPAFWCSVAVLGGDQKACARLARLAIGALAQSQQPQARAYLKTLAESSIGHRPQAMPSQPTGNLGVKPVEPIREPVDVQWSLESRRVAQKFLRKTALHP